MTMIPHRMFDNWWDNQPMDIFDQAFGMPTMPGMRTGVAGCPMPYWMMPTRTSGNLNETGASRIINDENKFAVSLDVHHFKPEEITVKQTEDTLVIEGRHEEKTDEHGMISRHFVRKYKLPKNCDLTNVISNMTKDGTLTIQAPKLAIEGKKERTIPITMGAPKMIGGCKTCDTDEKKK